MNILFDIDSYKASHYLQYPPNTTHIHAYLEARSRSTDEIVFFGLQPILASLDSPDAADIITARNFYQTHGVPFNFEGWKSLCKKHPTHLPLIIHALPEGTVTKASKPLLTVENTDPEFPWLTSWVETKIMRVWYPTTVATISRAAKKIIYRYLEKTSDNPEAEIAFKLHDFGSRGVSSEESAAIGGAAHLVNFLGTDTVASLVHLQKYYEEPMAGFSIAAAEHSTITAWGKENERLAYENMLVQFAKPGAIVAVVSDSYDIYNAVKEIWCKDLKQKVIDSGATIVIRPDSGEPKKVVLKVLEYLADSFGTLTNSKGFEVLNHVRVIQGDGVNLSSIQEILEAITAEDFSATNVAFGMGGALLQKVDRDTFSFGYKTSMATINNVDIDIQKSPVTDPQKKSKPGRQNKGMQIVYENGLRPNPASFKAIRDLAKLL